MVKYPQRTALWRDRGVLCVQTSGYFISHIDDVGSPNYTELYSETNYKQTWIFVTSP